MRTHDGLHLSVENLARDWSDLVDERLVMRRLVFGRPLGMNAQAR